MTTLADKAILSGADNRPPMLEKCTARARARRRATNIILQGLPPEVYALVSNHRIAKELWERIQLLMQGTSLTEHEREFNHNVYSPPSSIPQIEYASTVNQQQKQPEFPQLNLGLTVLVFKQCDDLINVINHMMSFLSVVVTSRYPTTNNHLRTSLNPRQQTTINDGRVTLQPVQGRQNSFATSTSRTYTPEASGSNYGKQRTVIKESLMQTVTLLKNDFMKEESRNIDREIALENKVNTTPVDYVTTKVEVLKELPKVSMVNTSLKKLKHHLARFDVVVKERTTTTTITEGSWGFEHTKACFKDEIIPFVKALKDIFNTFDQYLINELTKVQNFFQKMNRAVEQHRLESKTFEVKMNQVLNENERLLEQVINKDIVNIIMNSIMDNSSVNVHECNKCLKLETALLNKKDFIEKETYDKLFRSYTTLKKHCISLEVDTQLNQEIFQRDNSVSNQSALNFDQNFD
ncbi:hypothetical protein Tco_1368415 [Tanacetum coccineum]